MAVLTTTDQDGLAYIQDTLREYGFSESESIELTEWAKNQLIEGNSPNIIRQQLWEQPAFKRRFKVIFDRRAKGLPAISPAEVLDYEARARQLFQSAGLPPGFYDSPDDFYNFMVNDVSLTELNARVELARTSLYSVDTTTRAEMKRLYGLSDGQEVAYILDPKSALPLLQNQFISAQTAGASVRSGYGQLTLTEAESLTSLGVDPSKAASGFGALVQSKQLFGALPGFESAESDITRSEQLSAAFGGDAAAAQKVARRGEARAAASKGGGGFVAGQEGFSGLGTATK